jgi:hypothetical protein
MENAPDSAEKGALGAVSQMRRRLNSSPITAEFWQVFG